MGTTTLHASLSAYSLSAMLITSLLIMRNSFPDNGLLKQSDIVFTVGKHLITSFLMIESATWNKRMSKWRVLFPELNFPFSANLILLVLSWNVMLKLILIPSASMNHSDYATLLVFSLTAINYTSVELFKITFWLVELDDVARKPMLTTPPVWLIIPRHAPRSASMRQYKCWRSPALNVNV